MHIILGNSNNINEGYEDRIPSFRDLDYVIGPDGTIYKPKFIMALVNNACDILMQITQGTVTKYLGALPILYTFGVPTMATDGKFIYINPGFVMELYHMTGETVMGISFVILHEVYHNLFMHVIREQADPVHFSDHERANDAQDYEINWVIEHSFPDMRDPKSVASEEGISEDEAKEMLYNKDGSRVQILEGVTKMCNGLINPKFANMCWEEIYDKLTPQDRSGQGGNQEEQEDKDDDNVVPTTADFDDGYRDGWNDAIRELRAQGLVENVKVTIYEDFINKCVKLFEAKGSDDYNAGYAYGKKMALEAIKKIMNPQPPMPGGGSPPPQPHFHPIDGLDTMKPLNAPKQDSQGSGNSRQDPNVPIEQPKQNGQGGSSSNNQNQGQQKPQQGQQGGGQGGASDAQIDQMSASEAAQNATQSAQNAAQAAQAAQNAADKAKADAAASGSAADKAKADSAQNAADKL